jgi:hypothetical protein
MWTGALAFARVNSWQVNLGAVPGSHAPITMSGSIDRCKKYFRTAVIRRLPQSHLIQNLSNSEQDRRPSHGQR